DRVSVGARGARGDVAAVAGVRAAALLHRRARAARRSHEALPEVAPRQRRQDRAQDDRKAPEGQLHKLTRGRQTGPMAKPRAENRSGVYLAQMSTGSAGPAQPAGRIVGRALADDAAERDGDVRGRAGLHRVAAWTED